MSDGSIVHIEFTGTIDLPHGTVDSVGNPLHVGDVVRCADATWIITNDWWDRGVFKGVWLETKGIYSNSIIRTRTATHNVVKVKQ